MALALHDGLLALLATRRGEVADLADLVRLRIEREHLGADIERLGTEHVEDAPVAGGAHAIIGVVALGKARVEPLRDQLARRLEGIARLRGAARDRPDAEERQCKGQRQTGRACGNARRDLRGRTARNAV